VENFEKKTFKNLKNLKI